MLLFIKMYKRLNIVKNIYKTYSKINRRNTKITNPWSGKKINITKINYNKNYEHIEESIINNYFKH